MNTAARAKALAQAAALFPLLGKCEAEDLLELVEKELGHRESLDGFRPYAAHFSRAIPRQPILHILSGNTPHAALQSLIRGLLLGAKNRLKLPSAGIPEVPAFLALLPDALSSLVETATDLPAHWLSEAKAAVVFGSDETIAYFRRQIPAGTPLEEHGHRWSIGVIFQTDAHCAALAARDASLYNQKGCLSPHDYYVAGDAAGFAKELAIAMQRFGEAHPPAALTAEEAAEIYEVRARYRFRAAGDSSVELWESGRDLRWTVIYEESTAFAPSCLNRVIYVKPLPAGGLTDALGDAAASLGAISIWPPTPDHAETVAALAPSRVCALGRMQFPAWTWHQEGRQVLAPLVRWVDFEPEIG